MAESLNKFEQALSEFKHQCQSHRVLKNLRIVETDLRKETNGMTVYFDPESVDGFVALDALPPIEAKIDEKYDICFAAIPAH